MIDLKCFKNVNDSFGHKVGYIYLRLFARTINSIFKDSLVCHIHGDEFVIVTNMNEQSIFNLFNLCQEKLDLAVSSSELPCHITFNAGSTKATNVISTSKEIADLMMYNAKKENKLYQPFNAQILRKKQEKDEFISYINSIFDLNEISYVFKNLFDLFGNQVPIKQIYTRKKDGTKLFTKKNYEFLRTTKSLISFDCSNLVFFIRKY